MIKSITLTDIRWIWLQNKIKEDYPPSVWLSRSRMKRTLGFTTRKKYNEYIDSASPVYYLDFFSEKKKTFFFVKYTDIINNKKETMI